MLRRVYPTLGPIPTHALFVGLGVLAAAAVFVVEARRRGQTDERVVYVVLGALVGGAIFMRLGTWMQHLDPRENASLGEHWLYGNRSILGGLFGAWLGVHVAKRLVGYRLRTGDLFAPAVALGMAVGRVGCLLTELPGTPTGSTYGLTLDANTARRLGGPAGVPLHPSFLYEIAFHAVAFCLLWFWLRHRLTAPGETLTLYLAGYGLFRFGVEFVRGNEVVWAGVTRPQLFLVAILPVILARVAWQARRGVYRLAPGPVPVPAAPKRTRR
jgi:prolipoprotein diacylglyceryltransferase